MAHRLYQTLLENPRIPIVIASGPAGTGVCPLAYMRGRTFDNAWIIADEMQNSTPNQMRMVMTRIGKDSKLIITGDTGQYDRGFENNGLVDLLERLKNYPINGLEQVQFGEGDIKRHEIIKEILRLYAC